MARKLDKLETRKIIEFSGSIEDCSVVNLMLAHQDIKWRSVFVPSILNARQQYFHSGKAEQFRRLPEKFIVDEVNT